MSHTGPVRHAQKMGSTKAAAQVAAKTIAGFVRVRSSSSGTVPLSKDSATYHAFRDAIARAISEQFASPVPREVLEFNFALEPHPLLVRAAREAGVSKLVWPRSFALWVTRRDGTVEVSYHEPSLLEHKITYSALLAVPPTEGVPDRRGRSGIFARIFAPGRA